MRSFVRSYAKSIGLDPEEVTLQLEDYLQVSKNGSASGESASTEGAQKKKEGFFLDLRWKPRPIFWVISGGIIVLVLAYLVHSL